MWRNDVDEEINLLIGINRRKAAHLKNEGVVASKKIIEKTSISK